MTCCYSLIMPKALFYFFYTKVMFSISIDHNILLGHLRMWVRITGATLNWFCMSYHCYPDYVSFGENWGTFKTVYFAQLSLHKCSVLGCHIFLQLNLKYLTFDPHQTFHNISFWASCHRVICDPQLNFQ